MNKLLILGFLIILSGCATHKETIELHSMLQKEIKSCEIIVPTIQEKITAQIEESKVAAYTGGGLLFGLVDVLITSHRNNRAETYLKPVNEVLKDFSLKQIIEEKIGSKLKEISWLGCKKVSIFEKLPPEDHKSIVGSSNHDVVVFLNFDYKFTPKLDSIIGFLNVIMYPASKKMCACIKIDNPQENPIYKKKFMVSESLANSSDDMGKNIEAWMLEEGKMVKETILKLLDKAVCQLKKELMTY